MTDDRAARNNRIVARAVVFLWPDRWTRTRRGLLLCVFATFALAGSLAGVAVGLFLTAAGVRL